MTSESKADISASWNNLVKIVVESKNLTTTRYIRRGDFKIFVDYEDNTLLSLSLCTLTIPRVGNKLVYLAIYIKSITIGPSSII